MKYQQSNYVPGLSLYHQKSSFMYFLEIKQNKLKCNFLEDIVAFFW